MAQVFISFIHEEEEVAIALQRVLEHRIRQVEFFLSADKWKVFAGEVWLERIEEELESAKVVVLCLSPRSISRPWVNFEAGGAWLAHKTLIPVCLDGLRKGKLPKPYSSIQAVDLPAEIEYLIDSVAHHLGTVASPTPPPNADEGGQMGVLRQALDELRGTSARKRRRPRTRQREVR